jgi:YVTN family beta-propeller protein
VSVKLAHINNVLKTAFSKAWTRISIIRNFNCYVSVVNADTKSLLKNIIVGEDPRSVSINPNTNKVYVANSKSNTISVVDGKTNSIIKTLTVGKGINPYDVATNTIYVTNTRAGLEYFYPIH